VLKLRLRKMTALRIVCSAMLLVDHCSKIANQMCPAELVAAVRNVATRAEAIARHYAPIVIAEGGMDHASLSRLMNLAAAGTAGAGNVFFDLVALSRWNQFSFAFDMPCVSTAFPACRSLFGLRWRVLRAIT
jgi:hypothetical protein